MPRCYMVKKALCNKYMSVTRGFENWGRAGRDNSPSPTAMQLPVSPIEACTAPPVAQECLTNQLKDLTASASAKVPESPSPPPPPQPPAQFTHAKSPPRNENDPPSPPSTGATTCPTRSSTSSPLSHHQEHRRQEPFADSSDPIVKPSSASPSSCIVNPNTLNTSGNGVLSHVNSSTSATPQQSPTPPTTTTTSTTSPPLTRPTRSTCITPGISTITSSQVSVVTMHHPITQTINQNSFGSGNSSTTTSTPTTPASSMPLVSTSEPPHQYCFSRLTDHHQHHHHQQHQQQHQNQQQQNCPPVCPSLDVLVPVQTICHMPIVQDTPLFRDRSAAETEAAHDLLELSRSLPPLPPPSVAVGPQNVVESSPPTENVQEISIYQPAEPPPIYQLNTIDLGGSTATVYQQQPSGLIYDPNAAATIVQQTSTGVFIPLSPVQEILFTYATAPSGMPSIIAAQPAPIEPPPLTPPASECSSDIENNNPNSQPPSQRDKEVQTITEQVEVKPASYTYDTLLVADGRSKNKKQPSALPPQTDSNDGSENSEPPEAPKAGRYVCCECGKQYATSSNLSRHKQTHRSIDSQSAKKCIHCGKAYVSMPALAMHVLTHKLTHSCGVCGKMFSRPWLLQGHLRSHTGEKPYGCAHCGKAFADRSNLRAHMQTHSSDKNYECPKCHKSFALKSYLNKHLESACQRENCDECSNDIDNPTPYVVVSSPNSGNSEPTSFPRMMRGVNEDST